MLALQGIIPALITPFRTDGAVDHQRLANLVEHLTAKGVDGFYTCGSTGEAFLLSEEERMRCLETVIAASAGRAKVVAHVGAIAEQEAIRLAQHAEKAGADAVSACAPFYYKFSAEEVLRYYVNIAHHVSLPVVCYNFPAMTGFTLTVDMVKAMGEKNERICAVKNTTYDLYHLERLKARVDGLTVFNGHDEVLLSGLAAGADGAIGSTFNVMPEPFIEITRCFKNGDIAKAAAIQRDVNYMIDCMVANGVFPSIKSLLRQKGLIQNGCRAPFTDTTPEQDAALSTCFEQYVAQYCN